MLEEITYEEIKMVRKYLNNYHDTKKELYWDLDCLAMASVAKLCVIPIQDYLGYGKEARINRPSTLGINWKWRMRKGEFTDTLADKILDLTRCYGRF